MTNISLDPLGLAHSFAEVDILNLQLARKPLISKLGGITNTISHRAVNRNIIQYLGITPNCYWSEITTEYAKAWN